MKISPYAAFLVAMMSASASAQFCFAPDGSRVNTAGPQESSVDARTEFSRRGSADCPCSFAKAECKLGNPVIKGDVDRFVVSGNPGDDCSDIVINGEEAAAATSYPEINVVQDISICNYNTANKIQLSNAGDKKVQTRFYYPTGESQTNVSLESFKGQDLPYGQCLGSERNVVLPSNNVKSFMDAILQGGQATTSGTFIPGAFCYAYTFHRIDIGMFYPTLGECKMSTSTSCTVDDDEGTDCKDYINNSVDSCDLFKATFNATACNDNDRIVLIQKGASNFKINNYQKDENGKYGRNKTDLKLEMVPGSCQTISFPKDVNPCEKNFWQVNVEGREYIGDAENGWHYKDKDCLSYTFDELPQFIDPGAPSVPSVPSEPTPAVPTASDTMTPALAPQVVGPPTKSPSPSRSSKGKADGKAKQKTEDGEWEYVRRRRRG